MPVGTPQIKNYNGEDIEDINLYLVSEFEFNLDDMKK